MCSQTIKKFKPHVTRCRNIYFRSISVLSFLMSIAHVLIMLSLDCNTDPAQTMQSAEYPPSQQSVEYPHCTISPLHLLSPHSSSFPPSNKSLSCNTAEAGFCPMCPCLASHSPFIWSNILFIFGSQ